MTFVQLSYVIAVDTHRHFGKAAESCHVTQPTLSMQIHKLEETLGILIFDRSRQPVEPTDAGALIIAQARKIVHEVDRIEDIVKNLHNDMSGEIRLGVIPTLAPYLLPLFITSFSNKYPNVVIIVEELQTLQIIAKIKNDTLNAGLLATPLATPGILEQPLFYEPFVGYVSAQHDLAQHKEISAEDLELTDLWLLQEGHCFREQAIRLCRGNRSGAHVDQRIFFESGNLETLKKLVEQNFGMTLLPYLATVGNSAPVQRNLLRRFSAPAPTREISLVYGRAYLKKNILDALAREIQNVIPATLLDKNQAYVVELGNE